MNGEGLTFWPPLLIAAGLLVFVLGIVSMADWLQMQRFKRRLDGAKKQAGKRPPASSGDGE
jgi:hypothetical protein